MLTRRDLLSAIPAVAAAGGSGFPSREAFVQAAEAIFREEPMPALSVAACRGRAPVVACAYFDRTAAGGPIDGRTYFGAADILAIFVNDPLVAAPGTRMICSTFGYTLAALVLEEATTTPFLDLVQQRIAAPLGLASLAGDAPRRAVPGRVSGYGRAADVRELPPVAGSWANAPANNPAYKWAGGGLVMTPSDLARFGAAHFAPGAWSRGALATLFTVHVPDSSPPLGLGWRIDRDRVGRRRWHHAGGQAGARASLVVYPDQQISIAFATNATGVLADVLTPSEHLADAL